MPKARSFTFIEEDDGLVLSIVLDGGKHQYISITEQQGALAYSQITRWATKLVEKMISEGSRPR